MLNWSKVRGENTEIFVTAPRRQDLLADLARHLRDDQGFSIATLNLDHVVKLGRNAQFRTAYSAHTHVTADGNPIVWLSHLAGETEVELIPGSELIEPVVDMAAELDVPIALFGSTDASLGAAAASIEAKHSTINVAMKSAPPMGFDPHGEDASRAIEEIRESGARIVFLALGAPKQEIFAARAQQSLKNVGFLSIGAGLDFISGHQVRAPAWVRYLAAEWLWRLVSNPKRLAGRYAICAATLPMLTMRALAARRRRDREGIS